MSEQTAWMMFGFLIGIIAVLALAYSFTLGILYSVIRELGYKGWLDFINRQYKD